MPLAPTQWMWNGSVDEIHQPDRRALDQVVFDVLGLTAGKPEAAYEAVVTLLRARLEKPKASERVLFPNTSNLNFLQSVLL